MPGGLFSSQSSHSNEPHRQNVGVNASSGEAIVSVQPLDCSTCHKVCLFDRIAPIGEDENSYGVVWKCPGCQQLAVELCPVGPLVPTRDNCLNCGEMYNSSDVCPACGLTDSLCAGSLGLHQEFEADPIEVAKTAFHQGLFRNGLAVLNRAIRDDRAPPEAWFGKSRFFNMLGYNRSAAEMIEAILNRYDKDDARIELLGEAAFLWAEAGRGEEALRNAQAAFDLGSRSIRTHYLRGRALALIGRLNDARAEMIRVLEMDPENTDAKRGLAMIDDALGSTKRRPWWKLWKS
jgi:tetratricopeptide (TPR) repeat protein